jgi:hypothetical protein
LPVGGSHNKGAVQGAVILSLAQLDAETLDLQRALSDIVDRYAEEDEHARVDERILNRLTGHRWRYLSGMSHVLLHPKRYDEAVAWLKRYSARAISAAQQPEGTGTTGQGVEHRAAERCCTERQPD